jgi:hypothetical protein
MAREILWPVDGRLVLLGCIVLVAAYTARNLQPVRPAGAVAAEQAQQRAVDAVLVEVDRAQLCYARRRDEYADTLPSLAFAGGHYMRTALENHLDITLQTSDGGDSYTARVSGDGADGVIGRDAGKLVTLDVGDRRTPVPATAC